MKSLCSAKTVSSEYMTHNVVNVLKLVNGGKTATGTVPGGARAAAARLNLGGLPPPGCPGCGALMGAIPEFNVINHFMATGDYLEKLNM